MPPEKSNHRKIPSRKRWWCLPSCFVGSLVSGSDGSHRSGRPAGSRPKLPWCRYRKKKKTAPLDGVRLDNEASAQKDSEPSEGRTSRSRGSAQQLQQVADSQLHSGIDSEQPPPRLPRISKQYSTGSGEAPPSQKSNTVRTRFTTGHPGSPVHIHPATSHKSSVRSGSLKPTAGIWVMVVTLAVMVFFGRASALISLCSCMFLVPLLSVGKDDGSDDDGLASREVDMDSDEYKKRVILEGLLERNGRKPSSSLAAMASADGMR